MTDYEVYASSRENGCNGGDITGLAISEAHQMWTKQQIIEMIRKEHHNFWSFVYRNGRRISETRVMVEPIDDTVKGPYLRTIADNTGANNLLELPIMYFDTAKNIWDFCPGR